MLPSVTECTHYSASPVIPGPVCSIYLSVYRTVVIPSTGYPLISTWQHRCWWGSGSPGPGIPLQGLELTKLMSDVRVGGGTTSVMEEYQVVTFGSGAARR